MPSDGVPVFPLWRNLALDVFWGGYEPLREPMEGRVRDNTSAHGGVQCTKGLGRLSVIQFGALWTFLHKDALVLQDFRRCACL